jgi:hypothetical protein
MKRILYASIAFVLVALMAGVFAFAGGVKNYRVRPAGFNLQTYSLMIAAPRVRAARNWEAGRAYGNGDLCRSTSHTDRVYWNVSPVTNKYVTVTMPDHAWGDAADGTTNVWRRVQPRDRTGIEIGNGGTNDIWLAYGYPAVTNAGILLKPGGTAWASEEQLQLAVYAICIDQPARALTQEY